MIVSRLLLVLAFCVGLTRCEAFASEVFKVDSAHSLISFKVRHLLGNAKGKFTKFDGTIEVSREEPEKSSVTVAIQTASIDTANAKRDEHLRSADFFDVQKFPEITFKSRQIRGTGSNVGVIVGDFTMHGVTRPITLHVELLGAPEAIDKNQTTRWRVTTAPIRRSQFSLGWSKGVEAISMIGDEVLADIQIEAVRAR